MAALTSSEHLATFLALADVMGSLDPVDALGQLRLVEAQLPQLQRSLMADALSEGVSVDEIRVAAGFAPASDALDEVTETPIELPTARSLPEFVDAVDPPSISLVGLALALRSEVFGQDAAIGAVAERIAASLSGLKLRPERPHGVVMLNGPSGTGKTTLARQLAIAVYGSPDAILKLDMSEYADAADARMKLIGASRIWKNSSREGLLTTRVIEKPRSVVLLDEFEKSSKEIWPLMLQVFDEGRLTSGWGDVADFSSTIVVMTTNLGASVDARTPEHVFPPELLGRVDVNVTFRPLTPEVIDAIAEKTVTEAVRRVSTRGWCVEVDDAVPRWLAANRGSDGAGVRGLQRDTERLLLMPLLAFEERQVRVSVRPDGRGLAFTGDNPSRSPKPGD